MKKTLVLLITIAILAVMLTGCGKKNDENSKSEVKTTSEEELKGEIADFFDKKDKQNEDTSEEQSSTAKSEEYYLSYVLAKTVVDGKENIFLTDERDMDNWQVPVKDAVPGDGNEYARIRFIGIDWKADGTVEQVYMSEFLSPNTFGVLLNPGTSGKLNVNSYGADAGGIPEHSEWDMVVNGTEVVLTNENGTVYHFIEDHFGE